MDFIISNEQLMQWCSYAPDEIKRMNNLNADLRVCPSSDAYYQQVANLMAEELIANNRAGRETKWIVPAGPANQWKYFTERVHREKISMRNLWIFMMDEFLDWESRPYPETASFTSLRGFMQRAVFSRIDPTLMCPPEQVIFPDPRDLDAYDNKIAQMGGIDTIWAGIGCKGLIAFCEAPHSRYYRISQEQFRSSKTRIVELNEDTIVALAERDFGGYYDMIPPKAVTVGMKSILSARRIVCMMRCSSWKATVLRVMLFCKQTTLEYPVTFAMKYIPKKIIFCEEETLDHPLCRKQATWNSV